MIRVLMLLLASALSCAAEEILLHASKAIVHGETLRYEAQTNKNCLGYWTKPQDWAEWKVQIDRPGSYEIEVWQGCGKGNGGSDVRVEVAGQQFDFVVDETGHFQSFVPRQLGRVHFWKAGEYALSVKPQNKKAAAVMDVRQVKLIRAEPVKQGGTALDLALGARRILFLGDSITYSGEYIEFAETYWRTIRPTAEFDIINLGLPSETVSGLSEPGHAGGAFPRPDLHERLDRALAKVKPDLIFACYGMNDGIYYPFGEERFAKFREGMVKLREKAAAVGATVVHLTPPVFDATALKGRTLPAGLAEYKQPFEGYNEVLDRYSEWLISQRTNGWRVIDIHGPMNRYIADRRKTEPDFHLAGDGVHPGAEGHWIMAAGLIGLDADVFLHSYPTSAMLHNFRHAEDVLKLVQIRQRMRKDAWLTDVGHVRPGMNKGKSVEETEKEADKLALEIAFFSDWQHPGKRIAWNGFESYLFDAGGTDVRVIAPRLPEAFGAWQLVESLTNVAELARLAGRGITIVQTANEDAGVLKATENAFALAHPVLNVYLFNLFGLSSEKPSEGIRFYDLDLPKYAREHSAPRDELQRPLIRKLGTVDLDLVETTPVVISNRLWRFEWVREGYWNNQRHTNYFRFRDPQTGEATDSFADGHEFGSAFVNEGTVYVTGTRRPGELNVFASRDLKNWEKWTAIPSGKYSIFNTSVCKAGDDFVLMFEIDKPADEAGVPFTARFAKSKDLRTWTMTPAECNYSKDRYTAPHCLRWLDGWFYDFYLEAHDGYEMRVVRSRDLMNWEASPLNPVLKASPDDKRIASAKMPDAQRVRVANAVNINNSDIDFCEFQGQLRITYSWGNQQGIEHLAEAIYDGSEAEFLRGWFPE